MWTEKNRSRYNRDHLRYPSDVTDEEWELIAPLIPSAKRGGGKRRVDMRAVMNGVMYVLSTGCQWRYIPKDLPPRSDPTAKVTQRIDFVRKDEILAGSFFARNVTPSRQGD
jgi:transposase